MLLEWRRIYSPGEVWALWQLQEMGLMEDVGRRFGRVHKLQGSLMPLS